MCSYPEAEDKSGNGNRRYGNVSKGENDNVQLFFKHMFCLLNIEIDKGDSYDSDNQKKCLVSEIKLSGTTISTQGTLDVKNCKTETIPVENAVIKRTFSDTSIKKEAITTSMIVQPIPEADPNLPEEEKQKRFVLTCVVDGIPFSCSMPDIKLEAGKKYTLKLKLSPNGGFVFSLNYSQTQKKENVFLHNSRKSIIFEVSKYQNNTNVLYVQRYNKKIKQPNRNVYF